MQQRRMSGILLHPSSLPGAEGIGTLGYEAMRFVEFLAAAGQSLWQVLPIGPVGYGNSPYSCYSAFAGNPLLVDLASLVAEGDLKPEEVNECQFSDCIDFLGITAQKGSLLSIAAARFHASSNPIRKSEFWQFCDSTFWLHDYALFMASKEHFKGKSWNSWPKELAGRAPDACNRYSEQLGKGIGVHKYIQWQFFRQWHYLKSHANSSGIKIIGDAPIFVAYDSADVWCNQRLFLLGDDGKPQVVAGVPPDYFSKTGQRWGNPLYNWKIIEKESYSWWISRLRSDFALYDLVRIDHFRGFEAFWQIPVKEKTAVKGEWVKGPGAAFFREAHAAIGFLPLIAEDLGVITPEVEAIRDEVGLPGMRILQFAFEGGAANPYLPHNYDKNSVVYTGTHDNDTTLGWFTGLSDKQKDHVCGYLRCSQEEIVWEMIRAAISSVAQFAIIPMQDLLELGSAARMNVPGLAAGNWGWRCKPHQFTDSLSTRLRSLSSEYFRQ